MFKILILITLLVDFVAAIQVKHIVKGSAELITTATSNYAVNSPTLRQKGWIAVSINYDEISFYDNDCKPKTIKLNELNECKLRTIWKTRIDLESVENPRARHRLTGSIDGWICASYDLVGNKVLSQLSFRGPEMKAYELPNGYKLMKFNDDNFSASKIGMPLNLGRVVITKETVTYLYLDGRVNMRPQTCLQNDERLFIDELKRELTNVESGHVSTDDESDEGTD